MTHEYSRTMEVTGTVSEWKDGELTETTEELFDSVFGWEHVDCEAKADERYWQNMVRAYAEQDVAGLEPEPVDKTVWIDYRPGLGHMIDR